MSIYDTPTENTVNEHSVEVITQGSTRHNWAIVLAIALGVAHAMILISTGFFKWYHIVFLTFSTACGIAISFAPMANTYVAKFGRACVISSAHIILLFFTAGYSLGYYYPLILFSIITICMTIAHLKDNATDKKNPNWWMVQEEAPQSEEAPTDKE